MALQTSGEISMFDICDEFGVPRNTPLSEFYRGLGIVPNISANSSIPAPYPADSPISLQDFYGARNSESVRVTEGIYSHEIPATGGYSRYNNYYGYAKPGFAGDGNPEFGSLSTLRLGSTYFNAICQRSLYTGERSFFISVTGSYSKESLFSSVTPADDTTLYAADAVHGHNTSNDTTFWRWDNTTVSSMDGSYSRLFTFE